MSDNVGIREIPADGFEPTGTGLQDFVLLLQDLVLESSDVRNFLTEMATTIAGQLSREGNRMSCGMTVVRWPKYLRAAGAASIGSVLAVPMRLQNQAQAVVNLYSPAAHGFTRQDMDEAENLTGISAKALDLALNIAHLRDARDDLTAALKSRTVIDTAIGAIMAQNRCSRDAAFQILVKTSSNRNVKLREVATAIISSIAGEEEIPTTYDE